MEQNFNFDNELSGKIALVTGGTKGTGKAIAGRLLQAGATVIITARNAPEEELQKWSAALQTEPGDLVLVLAGAVKEKVQKQMNELRLEMGSRLGLRDKNTANATVFYTVQSGKVKGLKLGASAFYTGSRNGGWNDNKAATTLRLIPLKAFTTVDLSAGYTLRKISLLAKISNLTNELNYFVHENYSVNPIAPRQFLTTVAYKF